MNLADLSDDDLRALQAKDYGRISDAGLRLLRKPSTNVDDNPEGHDYSDPTRGTGKQAMLGVARGAADIGNTLLKIPGLKQIGQAAYQVLGGTGNRESSLAEMDAENKGGAYSAGRLVGNIAGTAGVGNAMAVGARAVPALAKFAPSLASGGMSAGGLAGKTAIAARVGAGAGVGGASAAMIDPSEALSGAAIGAVAPFAIQGAIRGGQGMVRGGRALVTPFRGEAGAQQTASDMLRYLGIQGAQIAPGVSGVRPTLAEALTDPMAAEQAARMTDVLAQDTASGLGSVIMQKLRENNAGRLNALRGAGGNVENAKAVRGVVSSPIYQDAFTEKPRLSPMMAQNLVNVLELPGMKSVQKRAQDNIFNKANPLDGETGLLQQLHEAKMVLDAKIANLRKPGSASADESTAQGLEAVKKKLLETMGDINPRYTEARNTYREASLPVNQAQIADLIYEKAAGAMSDIAGNPRLMASRVMNAVGDEQNLIKEATGRSDLGKLDNVIHPDVLAKIRGVLAEIDRSAAVGSTAVGSNSATARRMVGTNALQQLLGPMGFSRGFIESPAVQSSLRPLSFMTSVPEDRVREQLAQILMGNKAMAEPVKMMNFNALENLLGRSAVPYAIQE